MSYQNQNNPLRPNAYPKSLLTAVLWAFLLVPVCGQAAPTSAPNTNAAAQTADVSDNNADANLSDDTDTDANNADVDSAATNDASQAALERTIAATYTPKIDALNQQNKALLTQNLTLQQRVDSLQTQVDVLIYERQGQLFLYGAVTVLVSMLIGAGIARLFWRQASRW